MQDQSVFVDEDRQRTMTGVAQESNAVCDSLSLQQLLEPLIQQQRDTVDKLGTLTSHVQVSDVFVNGNHSQK